MFIRHSIHVHLTYNDQIVEPGIPVQWIEPAFIWKSFLISGEKNISAADPDQLWPNQMRLQYVDY